MAEATWKCCTWLCKRRKKQAGLLVKIALAAMLLTVTDQVFAKVYCSAGPAQTQYLQPPSPSEVTPGSGATLMGSWHELPTQVAAIDCSAGTDDAGMTIRPIGYIPREASLNGVSYMTFYDVGNTMAPIFEFRTNGGAWVPISTKLGTGDYSTSQEYTLQEGGSVTIQIRYGWVRLRKLYAGDSAQWYNQAQSMVWGSPTYSGALTQYYVDAREGHAEIPIPLATCTFDGSGTDHGVDTLPPVDLGAFDASTFTQSPWKSIGIKNEDKCGANSIEMTFRSGPGYIAPDDDHFGVKMSGVTDSSLGIELQYNDPDTGVTTYPIHSSGNSRATVTLKPPAPGIDYGVQARLVKIGNSSPEAGTSGTSVIETTVNYL